MQLPGTQYHDHAWPSVRRMLAESMLCAGLRVNAGLLLDKDRLPEARDELRTALADSLFAREATLRRVGKRNAQGDSAFDLATQLVAELEAYHELFLTSFHNTLWRELPEPDGPDWLRLGKRYFSDLRGAVDAENYKSATGRTLSVNRLYGFRKVEESAHEVEKLFQQWQTHLPRISAILGRSVDIAAKPIEIAQVKSHHDIKAEWIWNWSATLARFTGTPGPFHGKSKKTNSLKVADIGEIQAELQSTAQVQFVSIETMDYKTDGAREQFYEALEEIGNQVVETGQDQIQAPPDDSREVVDWDVDVDVDDEVDTPQDEDQDAAQAPLPDDAVCESPREKEVVDPRAELLAELLDECDEPLRLAIYLKFLGPRAHAYPPEWLDEKTGKLPSLAKLSRMANTTPYLLEQQVNAKLVQLRIQVANAGSDERN